MCRVIQGRKLSAARSPAMMNCSTATALNSLSDDKHDSKPMQGATLRRRAIRLRGLVPNIETTSAPVTEISVAAGELANGAGQISVAIQQLDKVTQENTSAAEQLSASASELASQAERLSEAIGFFRSDDSVAAPAAAPAAAAPKKPAAQPAAPAKSRAPAPSSKGGFDFDLGTGSDDLDAHFVRRDAA